MNSLWFLFNVHLINFPRFIVSNSLPCTPEISIGKNHSLKDQTILRTRNVTIINDFTQNALRHNHYWMSNWNYRSYDILSSLKPRKNTFGYKNWRFQTCLIGNDSISLDFAISENYDIYVHTLYKYPCNLKKLRPQ